MTILQKPVFYYLTIFNGHFYKKYGVNYCVGLKHFD